MDDFAWCQKTGVTGFPTVVLREDTTMAALTVGYQPFDTIKPVLDAWVSGDLSVKKQVEAAQSNDSSQQVH
jgi:protein-disulfide isomerase-like protein with CxxC motif